MAAQRASDQLKPDDSASGVGSWMKVNEEKGVESRTEAAQPTTSIPVVPEPAQGQPVGDQDTDDDAPPPNFSMGDPMSAPQAPSGATFHQWGTAPATQAAKNLLGNQIRPECSEQLGSGQDERSVLIIDNRDMRITSPFQGWLVDEILLNAQSGINILSDRQLLRSPNNGYHMNIFYVRAMDGYKFILVGSMTSYGTVPCARWDSDTGDVLSHAAFQPFRWPLMRDDSSTWADVKIKIEGQLLLHLELRGYRSNSDMTVQLNYINDGLIPLLRDELFVPAVVVTIFIGWRVIAVSFEVGGRIYACSEKGVVVALDFPLCHFEVRMTALSSADSIGVDADRLEFRFRSAGDDVDLACSQITVPSTWLTLSRVSGPTLVQNAKWCRDRHARVEGPDQTMQMSQLAGIHAHWTAPLFQAQKVIVPKEAIASGQLQALTGPPMAPLLVAPPSDVPISVTEAFLDQVRTVVTGVSAGGSTTSVPRSFGPEPKVEEVGILVGAVSAQKGSELGNSGLPLCQFGIRRGDGVERAFFESTANQLGFGLCEAPDPPISAATAKARRAGAIKALSGHPVNPPRKFLKASSETPSATPLLDQENAARWKWAARLEEIGRKAGTFSKLLLDTANEKGLSHAEVARLRQLVLSSGAPRTMATHVTNWERFAAWAEAKGIELFPAEVISKRARTLKEAVPIPTQVVRSMELFVVDEQEPEAIRLFTWWWLCMVFASLRFDDAMHVRPDELVLNEEGLFGVAWQTKVERKRRGTKFVVPHVSFSGSDWLRPGWQLLQNEHFGLARDFWMRDLNSREAFREAPAQYQSVQWLKFIGRYALNHYHEGSDVEFKELCNTVNGLTAHSARVTMLDAAVHAGRSTEEIGLQANWKNPGPLVLKYTRNRSAIPAKMVQQLVKDMLVQAHPAEGTEDAVLDSEDPSAFDQFQFFVKTNGSAAAYDCRYHCAAAGEPAAIACGRLKLDECTHVGSCLPELSMLCKHCSRARPEIALAHAR
ncbi:unnamed protein product [Cladocopium goreaui]|uniref:Uncharacterized protein n=1 Tax=Cladocopium goreaui TaxID=2562237 RepID=A0A9P1FYU7_9DINO|nr:unnamed protein product [Cladocopium goreaui]